MAGHSNLAVGDTRITLAHFYNIAIGIPNIAARLTVFRDWRGDELRSPAAPQVVAGLDIGDPDIQEAVEMIGIGDAEGHRWLVGRPAAADVDDHPDVGELEVPGRIAVASAQDASAEHALVEVERSD